MKGGDRPNFLWLVEQGQTAMHLRSFEVIERLKAAIGDPLIRERPQALRRLQFR